MTPDQSEASLGELFGQLGSDLSLLLRKEVELAKVEARDEARRAGKAAAFGGTTAIAALLALIILSMALAWWIDDALNTALSFAIVGALWVVVAIVAAMSAKKAAKEIQPLPETTSAIKGAVTGERADEQHAMTFTDDRVLSTTHQISDTRPHESEHTS